MEKKKKRDPEWRKGTTSKNKSWVRNKRRPCRGWMDEEMIHRRMQIQQGEEPEGNCEMWHYPL